MLQFIIMHLEKINLPSLETLINAYGAATIRATENNHIFSLRHWKWKQFPRYWPFVRGNQRSPVNSPQKSQWRGALTFSLICSWIKSSVNTREAGDLQRHRTHYNVTVISTAEPYDNMGTSLSITIWLKLYPHVKMHLRSIDFVYSFSDIYLISYFDRHWIILKLFS